MRRLLGRLRRISGWIWFTTLWLKTMSSQRRKMMSRRRKSERLGKIRRGGSLFVGVREGQVISRILLSILISRLSMVELLLRVLSEVKVVSLRKEVDQKWYIWLHAEKSSSNLWEGDREKWIPKDLVRPGSERIPRYFRTIWGCWGRIRGRTSRSFSQIFCQFSTIAEASSKHKNLLIAHWPGNNRFPVKY